ncbi:hypothetical protein EDB85DRAFT_1890757 [Lactarius pseudohatsudake]|nr:hypothetical protein EDB85DRAFT_1890757 [Lactarius pseudohatsudake]
MHLISLHVIFIALLATAAASFVPAEKRASTVDTQESARAPDLAQRVPQSSNFKPQGWVDGSAFKLRLIFKPQALSEGQHHWGAKKVLSAFHQPVTNTQTLNNTTTSRKPHAPRETVMLSHAFPRKVPYAHYLRRDRECKEDDVEIGQEHDVRLDEEMCSMKRGELHSNYLMAYLSTPGIRSRQDIRSAAGKTWEQKLGPYTTW